MDLETNTSTPPCIAAKTGISKLILATRTGWHCLDLPQADAQELAQNCTLHCVHMYSHVEIDRLRNNWLISP